MTPEKLLQQVLDIENPWQIVRVRDDLGKRQVDVWVARPSGRSGWFFSAKAEAAPEHRERVWRHSNIGSSRCLVHAAPPTDPDSSKLQWCGDGDLPFTRAFSRQIAGLFLEGVKFQSICGMLDIAVADLWKFKHSLDHGKAGLSDTASIQLPAEAAGESVPEADHPVWEMLLTGTVNIDIRALSLKLLLTKQREQMRLITDSEVRLLKAHEMRRYFVRYEQQLAHELAQLSQY
jgi:hypothetical protein